MSNTQYRAQNCFWDRYIHNSKVFCYLHGRDVVQSCFGLWNAIFWVPCWQTQAESRDQLFYRGRILERNPDKSLKIFPPSYLQSTLQLCLRFLLFKLTQPLTVSVKEKRGKPDRILPYGLRNPYGNLSLRTLKIMLRNLNVIVRSWIRLQERNEWQDQSTDSMAAYVQCTNIFEGTV